MNMTNQVEAVHLRQAASRVGRADDDAGPETSLTCSSDTALALATVGLAIVALTFADEPAAREVDPLAYTLLVVASAPLLFRRRWPVPVVGAVAVVSLAYFALGYPGGPPTVLMLLAVYSVAAAGHRWWTATVTALFAGGGLLYRLFAEGEPLIAIAFDSALYVLVSLLGDAVHSRRQLRAESQERLRIAAAEREAETERRIAAERLRIARELHDVIAHTVTTMSIQAAAASDMIATSPEAARSALESARAAARDAMHELRATVTVLRDADDPGAPLSSFPKLDEVHDLADSARRSRLAVDVEFTGERRELSGAVELTGYRVAQEALTNVLRHADAGSATVAIRYLPGKVSVQVDDDGRGPEPGQGDGHGLRGLRERVRALGGYLHVGPAPAGGFRVRAEIPTREVDR